jgi:hypothetical protein
MLEFLLGEWDNEGEDVDEDFQSPTDPIEELVFVNDTLQMAFACVSQRRISKCKVQ